MGRMQVHAAAAARRSAEEHPAAETAAIPAEDIRVAEVPEAEAVAVDTPAGEAAHPLVVEAVVAVDILVEVVVAEVPEAVEGTGTKSLST